MYFDGSAFGNPGEADIGGVFRRRDGNISWVFSGPNGVASSTKAEILAALTGIRLARDGYSNFTIKGDSANGINWLAEPDSGPWSLAHYLTEVRDIPSTLNVHLGWISRELNTVVDGLAKAGVHRDYLFSDNSFPEDVEQRKRH
ncbi:PREDICTED: uncharacterized protein LOC109113959 [Nelumbo nucifera]|uniref:Uncharacterized protein LOC109113959 n=1 Tax=Nelumbo nucifera TaxID=4432 RepID=A0A1U8Q0E2_NELNU|nr:PREDICTED: uncharacterized protein LOC109113959 [Nelumbo nucifera]